MPVTLQSMPTRGLPSGISKADVYMHLEKILNSNTFGEAARLRDFLKYIVFTALEGKAEAIKEYHIAVEVFGRKESFDPRLDPIVRVEASRLRSKMEQYLKTEGQNDRLMILIPKGRYVPTIVMSSSLEDRLCEPQMMCCSCIKSLALLPLLNLSADPASQLLCDSLSEELIDMLTDVPGIRVMPRFSIVLLKDQYADVRNLGKLLGVEMLLEGSVRYATPNLRIKVRVCDTCDGFSRRLGSFDRIVEDPFSVQQDVCESVVTALKLHLFGHAGIVPANHFGQTQRCLPDPAKAHFNDEVSAVLEAAGKTI
jgi:TolB-like protein